MSLHVLPTHRLEAYSQPIHRSPARAARARAGKLLDLTVSNPTRAGLHYDAESILNSLSRPEAMDYDPQPKGLASAREAVAAYYREQTRNSKSIRNRSSSPPAPARATPTFSGCCAIPAMKFWCPSRAIRLFEFLADLEDVKLVPYPLLYDHGWQIDFPSLHKAVNQRTRAVVVVHPNNPTGRMSAKSERTLLNSFCREHELALIVDEVFLDYPHDGAPRPSFAVNQDVLTFTLSGLSKISGLPQMKLAWVATSGPEETVARGHGTSGGDCRYLSCR